MQQEYLSAMEIHNLWMNGNLDNAFCGDCQPARKHYIDVRNAMYRELMKDGYCELIEYYLSHSPTQMELILFCAMYDVLQTVSKGGKLAGVHPDYLICYNRKYDWKALSQYLYYIDVYTSRKDDMQRFYQKIKGTRQRGKAPVSQGAEIKGFTQPIHTPQPGPNPEEVSRKCRELEESANKRAEEILQQASSQRNIILQQAETQRRDIENEANVERSRILENANRDAEQIIAEANAEAQRIRDEALRQAEEAAQEEADALVQRQLSCYMRQQRSQWEEDRQALDNARADMSAAIPTLKEEICSITTSAGARMNGSLEAIAEQLTAMKTELLSGMNRWRSDLYKCEYGALINFYMSFIAVTAQFERDVYQEQTHPMTEEEELTILQRHSSRMNNLRSALLRAMEAMGICTFAPQNGDIFDSYSHATNDAEDDDLYNGRIIESCIAPGIQRVINGQTSDILHRATVQLRSEEENEG